MGLIQHMNADHAAALSQITEHYAGEAVMTAVDRLHLRPALERRCRAIPIDLPPGWLGGASHGHGDLRPGQPVLNNTLRPADSRRPDRGHDGRPAPPPGSAHELLRNAGGSLSPAAGAANRPRAVESSQ